MSLLLEDPEIDQLVERLVEKHKLSGTEVVRHALLREWERVQDQRPLVERGMEFVKALHSRSDPANGLPVDKAFIDSLYED